MSIKRGGHTFAGFDKPIRTPNHPSGKSHAVVIKEAANRGSLGSVRRVLTRNVRAKVRVLRTKLSGRHSRNATRKTSRRAKHLPHIGRTK